MLFNSYEFIFAFLPLALAGFVLVLRHLGKEAAIAWLVLASLFFYGWWNPKYLSLILLSLAVNFATGRLLSSFAHGAAPDIKRKLSLALGITFNLALLGYFKYANFFVENLNVLAATDFHLAQVVLPLAISFFTFQQIAYLVDAYQGITHEYNFLHYALFVTFFPQLIAGPIVHHKEMLPQFMRPREPRINLDDLAVGISIFSMGLFKKTVLADGVAVYATPVFDTAASGDPVTFLVAWGGALAYTLQLYFDFSGYSDMAIGAARMFGIVLPLNFHSPYKATSITEFWRRWHMTLSRFLRDYLYIPLGGNRRGQIRRYTNLMITMLLGGLWHGAGWTFVIWGGLHGLYLSVNHLWHHLPLRGLLLPYVPRPLRKGMAWTITFLAVVVGWVFFRAADFDAAIVMLRGMAGIEGFAIPNAIGVRLGALGETLQGIGVEFSIGGGSAFVLTWAWICILLPLTLIWPNTQEIMGRFRPAFDDSHRDDSYAIKPARRLTDGLVWQPNRRWATLIALTSVGGVLALSEVSEFLYFQL